MRKQRFDNMARSVQTTINGRIKSYTDVLRGSASLFQTSTDLTREQFHRYVEGLSLEQEFPGIEAINFARYVTDAERPAFEASMRKEIAAMSSGYPPFRITPPGRRASYNVITYIEPIAGWANRFGVDITGTVAKRRHTERSRETGELAASAHAGAVPVRRQSHGAVDAHADLPHRHARHHRGGAARRLCRHCRHRLHASRN